MADHPAYKRSRPPKSPAFLIPEGLLADEIESIRLRDSEGAVVRLAASEVETAVALARAVSEALGRLEPAARRVLADALRAADKEAPPQA